MRWHAIRPGRDRLDKGLLKPADTGVCVLCGARLNPITDYNQDCPNPRRLTRAAAMAEAQGMTNGKGS